jgi:hypothetical protein
MAAAAAARQPVTALEHYAELIDLRGKGFSCLRATRPYGGVNPRDQRMQDATGKIQQAIRAELVRREGVERVEAIERPPESNDHQAYMTSGRCSLTDADRARAHYRRALFDLERRLGLSASRRKAREAFDE